MDKIGSPHHYRMSIWHSLAAFFDRKGMHGLGESFWNNETAWKNKWRNGDPSEGERFWGSSHIFASCTDGWHVVKLFWIFHFIAAIVLYSPILPSILLDFGLYFFTLADGHHIFFLDLQNKSWKRDIPHLVSNIFNNSKKIGGRIGEEANKRKLHEPCSTHLKRKTRSP